ncbi:cell wall hydrolase [Kordiimonas sp.]|uniref:cell wall hydrolase n=1 Tax=Kordiimonas sp. TaxID=1970157 RepID=UPI003A94F29B
MRNIDLSARVAWGEARSEGLTGLQAVLNVMANRAKDRRWPSSLAGVATQPWQFSAYNENDPNRAKLEAVTDDDPNFAQAVELAARAVRGELEDVTGGATHYHSKYISPPFWTKDATVTARIGDHIFYSGVA